MPQRDGSKRRGGPAAATKLDNKPGNQMPDTPNVSEAEISRLKVDELRSQLKKHGVTGTSSLRKDELVKTLVRTLRAEGRRGAGGKRGLRGGAAAKKSTGGARTGPASSTSLKYAQEISSTDDESERQGRSLVTTDHDVIRQWAEERGAIPATVAGTGPGDHLGVLRFDFPRGGRDERLREVSWDDWFATFDERRLNFIYQQEHTDGRQSNFFQLENPDREDA
jgi:hypothetical protein